MRLTEEVYLVGSGNLGLRISAKEDCHVYLVNGGSELALIDAGSGLGLDRILKEIDFHRFDLRNLKKLFLTHAHVDHVGGAARFHALCNCEVYLPEAEAKAFENGDEEALGIAAAKRLGALSHRYTLQVCPLAGYVGHNDRFEIGELTLQAIHVPGHSKGSTCYLLSGGERRVLFSGDTVFVGGRIGLINCVGSSLADYRKSIQRLRDLDVDALFPGHFSFVLSEGKRDIEKACQHVECNLYVPPTIDPMLY